MAVIDVYYAKRIHDGAYIVKAWETKDSMYPLLFNNQFIGYTLTEVKRLVREKLKAKYNKVSLRWHDQGNA